MAYYEDPGYGPEVSFLNKHGEEGIAITRRQIRITRARIYESDPVPGGSQFLRLPLEMRLEIYEHVFAFRNRRNDWYSLILTNKQIYNEITKVIHKAHLFAHIPTASALLGVEWCERDNRNGANQLEEPQTYFDESPKLIPYFFQFASVHFEIGIGSQEAWQEYCQKENNSPWVRTPPDLETTSLALREAMLERWVPISDDMRVPSLEITFHFDCEHRNCFDSLPEHRLPRLVQRTWHHREYLHAMMQFECTRRAEDSLRIDGQPICAKTGKYVLRGCWWVPCVDPSPNAFVLQHKGYKVREDDEHGEWVVESFMGSQKKVYRFTGSRWCRFY